MLPPLRRWIPRAHDVRGLGEAAGALEAALGLPAALCRLLVLRGHDAETAARRFLRPRLDQVHAAERLADLDAALERIRCALRSGETILVHGDYDVDGVCATALYTRVLRSLGGRVVPFVPNRMSDGYDLGAAGLLAARRVGARLILTADCGIVAHAAVREARAVGIDVIVTDHHTPGPSLPDACAVVNPNRPDCGYPEKTLCGAGVAFKICEALIAAEGGDHEALLYHLDLVALATIADLVPLTGENRVFARYGLRVLAASRNSGVRALLRVSGLADRGALVAGNVSHTLAPRLNAAGRLADAGLALRLLLSDDEAAALPLAERLEATNRERREVDRRTLAQASEMLEREFDPARDHGVVLVRDGWHPGVIGIVASRVVELIHRPTILLAPGRHERARGSGRSIRGFDLYGAIRDCAAHLERFGGHRQAAGLDIRLDRIEAFRDAFDRRAARELAGRELCDELHIDLDLRLADATPRLARLLLHFGPFGMGNPTPVFLARRVRLDRMKKVGADQRHLRVDLVQGDERLRGIGFDLGPRWESDAALRSGPLDVAFQLQEDQWNGRARVQARVLDLRPADAG
ncbi:MAG: single-stranded-DNA-specific exonuclease RecJ [Longimicrobiales bacterium]